MPVYEYQCKACQREFEYQQRMSDPDKTTCEVCGGSLDRLISRTAFQLKGSGWYKDLYSSSQKPEAAASKTEPAAATASADKGSAAASGSAGGAAGGSGGTGGSTSGSSTPSGSGGSSSGTGGSATAAVASKAT